jgi:hypothetical protein
LNQIAFHGAFVLSLIKTNTSVTGHTAVTLRFVRLHSLKQGVGAVREDLLCGLESGRGLASATADRLSERNLFQVDPALTIGVLNKGQRIHFEPPRPAELG